jgi:hypothetical protein
MSKLAAIGLGLALALVGVSCGGGKAGSCIRANDCLEYDGSDFSAEEQYCNNGIGTWVDGTCSRDGAVGGCRKAAALGAKFSETTWYYEDTSDAGASDVDGGNSDSVTCPNGTTFVKP